MSTEIEKLLAVLYQAIVPDTSFSYKQAGIVFDIQHIQGDYHLDVIVPYPAQSVHEVMAQQLRTLLFPQNLHRITFKTHISARKAQGDLLRHKKIKNILAVVSGKGGVGKSTVSTYLALALQQEGARVGILDADIYGPSQPTLLGTIEQKPELVDGKYFAPLQAHGLVTMSIGNLVAPDTAMIWRGPMVSTALQQLLRDTLWPELDYLIVDLPPGTGDIQLTMAQKIPISGALIVATSQHLALADATKALMMLRKVNITPLGVIENMGQLQCPHCAHKTPLFGHQGVEPWAHKNELAYLAHLPFNPELQRVAAIAPMTQDYLQLAHRVGQHCAQQSPDRRVPLSLEAEPV